MARDREIVAKAGEKYTVDVLDKDGNVTGQETHVVPDGMERERVEVNDKKVMKEHFFNTFTSELTWMSYLASTTPENVKDAFAKWQYAQNLAERATVREAVAQESTIIKVDGKDIDLMALPVKNACLAINGAMAIQAATGKDPQNAFIVARRKLVAENKASDTNGQLTPVAA